jgi:hypothetical protein
MTHLTNTENDIQRLLMGGVFNLKNEINYLNNSATSGL